MSDQSNAPVFEIGFVSPMNFGGFCLQIFSAVKHDRGTKLYSQASIDHLTAELEAAKANLVLATDEILMLRAALLHVGALGVCDSSGITGIVSGNWTIAPATDRIADILTDLSTVASSWVVEASGASANAQNQCAMQMMEAIERWSNKLHLGDASPKGVKDATTEVAVKDVAGFTAKREAGE